MAQGWWNCRRSAASTGCWTSCPPASTPLVQPAPARPVIIPETIVVGQGKVFISRNFRASCNFLGVNFQPVHDASGWEKGHIERMLGSVGTLFAQFVAGYTGFNAERRGRHVEQQ